MEQEERELLEYEKPEVRDYGDLRELTAGTIRGPLSNSPSFHHALS